MHLAFGGAPKGCFLSRLFELLRCARTSHRGPHGTPCRVRSISARTTARGSRIGASTAPPVSWRARNSTATALQRSANLPMAPAEEFVVGSVHLEKSRHAVGISLVNSSGRIAAGVGHARPTDGGSDETGGRGFLPQKVPSIQERAPQPCNGADGHHRSAGRPSAALLAQDGRSSLQRWIDLGSEGGSYALKVR